MLNQTVLVGRILENIELEESGEKPVAHITLTIPRSFKNADGEYETDLVPLTLCDEIAKNTSEYCKKGDILGVKCRLQSQNGKLEIIAEKVTFLSCKGEKENE